jgi:hypothetical protein
MTIDDIEVENGPIRIEGGFWSFRLRRKTDRKSIGVEISEEAFEDSDYLNSDDVRALECAKHFAMLEPEWISTKKVSLVRNDVKRWLELRHGTKI